VARDTASERRGRLGLSATAEGVLWILVTVFAFVVMAVAVRKLSHRIDAVEILLFRNVVAVVFTLPLLAAAGAAVFHTQRIHWHGARAVVQFGAQYSWVYALPLLPLAEITALEFTVPLWTAPLAILFLGERVGVPRWIATVLGFVGVLVILRPGIAVVSPAAVIVLAGCIGFAAAGVLVKYLTRTDDPRIIVLYSNLMQMPVALVPTLFVWVTPEWEDVPWILAWGLVGLAAQHAMAQGLRLIDVTLGAPIDFARLPLIAIVGYALYDELMDPLTAVGALIIFGSNYYAVREETRRRRTETGEKAH
jgi:drug/metabolite transporter (DMT)-like permease